MDQVTASISLLHETGEKVYQTEYLSTCGCNWVVDMWGNVRAVRICERDLNDLRWGEGQLTLARLTAPE